MKAQMFGVFKLSCFKSSLDKMRFENIFFQSGQSDEIISQLDGNIKYNVIDTVENNEQYCILIDGKIDEIEKENIIKLKSWFTNLSNVLTENRFIVNTSVLTILPEDGDDIIINLLKQKG
jgi:hypothetical protein